MPVLCHPLSASGDDWFLAAENILSASFCTGRTLSWRNGRTALEMPGVLLQGQLGEACTSKDVLPCCVTCAHIILSCKAVDHDFQTVSIWLCLWLPSAQGIQDGGANSAGRSFKFAT